MKFVMSNLWLIGLALGSGAMLLWPMLRGNVSGATELSPREAVMLINREHAVVLDVRETGEFAGGHIAEARNIPLSQLAERVKELQRFRDKPLLVNCQGGVRSAKACGVLKQSGFSKIYNLQGGVSAWKEANLPLVKEA